MSSYPKPWKAKPSYPSGLPLYYKDKLQKDRTSFSGVNKYWFDIRRKRTVAKIFAIVVALYISITGFRFFFNNDSVSDPLIDPELWLERKEKVKEVFLESWSDYARHGWGTDVYSPIKQQGKNMSPDSNPAGWIIVDSLDTLAIMGLKDELHEARSWVKNELDFDKIDNNVNVFETTIRTLGGLLSAHYLTDDDIYIEKSVVLANKLLGAFDSVTGIPFANVNLKTGKFVKNMGTFAHSTSVSEVGSLQLEFKYLAKLTGEKLYWEKVEKVMKLIDDNHPIDGLVPTYIFPGDAKFKNSVYKLGARADSYYEYLLKQYLQTGEEVYSEMYQESFLGIKKHFMGKSQPNRLTFLGEKEHGLDKNSNTKMDHLVCMFGGLFALGATNGESIDTARKSPRWTPTLEEEFEIGKKLGYTCYKMYHDTPNTGLAPEIVVFNTNSNKDSDMVIKKSDTHNLQRPETVETLFYLYKITKDPIYRKWGWEIFENFVNHLKVTEGGKDNKPRYACLRDVTIESSKYIDNMESFWLSETLKYLYLLFDDSENEKLDITKNVFSTEAHPFPKFDDELPFPTGWKRSNPNVKVEEKVKEFGTPGSLDHYIEQKESQISHHDDVDGNEKPPIIVSEELREKQLDTELLIKKNNIQADRSVDEENKKIADELDGIVKKTDVKKDAKKEVNIGNSEEKPKVEEIVLKNQFQQQKEKEEKEKRLEGTEGLTDKEYAQLINEVAHEEPDLIDNLPKDQLSGSHKKEENFKIINQEDIQLKKDVAAGDNKIVAEKAKKEGIIPAAQPIAKPLDNEAADTKAAAENNKKEDGTIKDAGIKIDTGIKKQESAPSGEKSNVDTEIKKIEEKILANDNSNVKELIVQKEALAAKDNEAVANKAKSEGVIPEAQPIAKPLDNQAVEVEAEAQNKELASDKTEGGIEKRAEEVTQNKENVEKLVDSDNNAKEAKLL